MLREMAKRTQQPNLSFFAFTATPKPKTLTTFGTMGDDGKPRPFHLYSSGQAIQEGFILNVLANYTTYKAYYKLIKRRKRIPQVQKRAATKALARYLSFNETPHRVEGGCDDRAFLRHRDTKSAASEGDGGHGGVERINIQGVSATVEARDTRSAFS